MDADVIIYQPMQFVYYLASARIFYDYNIQLKSLVLLRMLNSTYNVKYIICTLHSLQF